MNPEEPIEVNFSYTYYKTSLGAAFDAEKKLTEIEDACNELDRAED
jgi:hypothetical protein